MELEPVGGFDKDVDAIGIIAVIAADIVAGAFVLDRAVELSPAAKDARGGMVADRHVHAALVDLASAVADFGRNLAGHFAQLGLDRDFVDRADEGVSALTLGIDWKNTRLNSCH